MAVIETTPHQKCNVFQYHSMCFTAVSSIHEVQNKNKMEYLKDGEIYVERSQYVEMQSIGKAALMILTRRFRPAGKALF